VKIPERGKEEDDSKHGRLVSSGERKELAHRLQRDRGRLTLVDGVPMATLVEREVGLVYDLDDSLRDRRGVTKAENAMTGVILEKMSSGGDPLGSPRTWRPAFSGLKILWQRKGVRRPVRSSKDDESRWASEASPGTNRTRAEAGLAVVGEPGGYRGCLGCEAV
jgi:hypothetical protein